MTIKNYNSTLSLSHYAVGNAYAFYIHNYDKARFVKADEKTIRKYSSIITEIINNNTYNTNDGIWEVFTRVIGVIVDKHKSVGSNDIDSITVMFKTADNEHVLNKYAVNTHDVLTNNKDHIFPSAVLRTV